MDKKRLFLLLTILMVCSHLARMAESRKVLPQTGGIPAILDENDHHQIMDGDSKEGRVVVSTRRWALDELDYETGANHKHEPKPRPAQRMD